jgi:hypothetical protein
VERFTRTVSDEFFQEALRRKLYELVEALQRDLWTSDLSTTTESLPIRAIGTWKGGL